MNFHSKYILPLINKYSSIYTSIHSLCTNVKMCTLMCQHLCLSVYLYRITIESDKKIKPNDEHCYIPLGSSKLGRSSRCNCAICFVFWSQTLFTFLINTPAWKKREVDCSKFLGKILWYHNYKSCYIFYWSAMNLYAF